MIGNMVAAITPSISTSLAHQAENDIQDYRQQHAEEDQGRQRKKARNASLLNANIAGEVTQQGNLAYQPEQPSQQQKNCSCQRDQLAQVAKLAHGVGVGLMA
jgi:hypothetical protein